MDFVQVLLLLLQSLSAVHAFHGELDERLSHYDTLHHTDIHHHMAKRSVSQVTNEMVVSLDTLGQHFKLHLQSIRELFSRNFTAYSIDKNEDKRAVAINPQNFYEGYVEGESDSLVHAYWEGHDLAATIETKEDTYVIEPSWRLLPSSHSYSMISYRKSDMRQRTENDLGEAFCGLPEANQNEAHPDYLRPIRTAHSSEFVSRRKRQSNSKRVCTLALVADYDFFEQVGFSNEVATINYMATVISFVNTIFKNTKFGSFDAGFSLQIRKVLVHTSPTAVSEGGIHYNMVRSGTQWGSDGLLKAFRVGNYDDVCLAHLFTHQAFNNGILGQAYTAPISESALGGICSKAHQGIAYNTGWSSTKNSAGLRLTSLEASIVTAHEFGHNWGSPHDPDSCLPDSGGNYLMYTYSTSGYEVNNKVFSGCSTDTIGGVLEARKDSCFVEPDAEYCGNRIVESPEECDPGPVGVTGPDTWCSPSCELREDFVCSDTNDVCCTNGQYAASSKKCRFTGSLTASCLQDTFCSGSSKGCPDAVFKPNGTACGDNGACVNGECWSICEIHGYLDCHCEDLTFTCKRCCKLSDGGTCLPLILNDQYLDHVDGHPCTIGTCYQGECEKQILSASARVWDVINFLKENGIAAFFRSNIVMSVVMLSLIIYMPIVLVILVIDWKNDRKDDKLAHTWFTNDSDQLLHENDDRVIRPTYTKRRPLDYRRTTKPTNS